MLLADGKGVDWLQEYPPASPRPRQKRSKRPVPHVRPASMVSVVVGDADVVEAGLAMLTEVVRR